VNVVVYESFADLPEKIRKDWSYPAQPEFFLTLDWFSCLHETSLSISSSPRIYAVVDERGETGCLLYCSTTAESRNLTGMTNFYTVQYQPVLAGHPVNRTLAIAQLIKFIANEDRRWHSLRLNFLSEDDIDDFRLQGALHENGFSAHSFFQYENWFINVAGRDFSTYYSERPSQLRNTIKRKERKLRKTNEVRIEILTENNSDLSVAISDYTKIYNNSWKDPEPFPEFTPSLIRTCANLGILRLGLLYIQEQPAAAQLWIVSNSRATIYKLAYDEQFAKTSVGSILSKVLFEHAIDIDHVDEIDYGIGGESYKKDWMDSMRKIVGVQAYNRRTCLGLFRGVSERIATALKKLLRSRD